jgi:aspartate/methionine/tyrosine aminotransferase
MLLVFSVLLSRGEPVVLPNPHYSCYPNFIRFLEGEPVFVPVNEEDGFKYRRDVLAPYLTPRTRVLMKKPCRWGWPGSLSSGPGS